MLNDKLILMYGMLFTINGLGIAVSYWLLLVPPGGRAVPPSASHGP